jgi:hypothetical protein
MMSTQEERHSNFLSTAQILDVAEVDVNREPLLSDFGSKFVGFGSCFAVNMRRILESFGFEFFFTSEISAHYNTETIANIFEFISGEREPGLDDLYTVAPRDVFLYRCHFKHRFYGDDAGERALARMRELIGLARTALENADFILITLGTSRVTRLKSNGQALAAVIQLDREHWTLESLSVEENIKHLRRVFRSLAVIRRGRPIKAFLTVSPQRYLFGQILLSGQSGDGSAVVDNFLSKAILRVAVDRFIQEGAEGGDIRYFPAFEIVYEELRQFESLAHYDLCHIDQIHTPQRVIKKFLQAYGSDAVLDQIVAMTEIRHERQEMERLISGGMPKDAPEIQRRVDAMLTRLAGFGVELAPPGIGLTYYLIQHYRPGQSIRGMEFRHMGFGNRLALARNAAAEGDRILARRIALELVDELDGRRTHDPEAGREIEHRVHDEAVEFLRQNA